MMKYKVIEAALVAYYIAHGFDVRSFEDIIRLYVKETINERSPYR